MDCWQVKCTHVQFRRLEDAVATHQSAEEEPITMASEPLVVKFDPQWNTPTAYKETHWQGALQFHRCQGCYGCLHGSSRDWA